MRRIPRLPLLAAALVVGGGALPSASALALPSASARAADPSWPLTLQVDDSRADLACGVAAHRGGSVTPYDATLANSTNVAVHVVIDGDGPHTLTGAPLAKLQILSPHSRATLSGTFGKAGQQTVISCNAGDASAVLMNAIVRPVVGFFSPVSLDDADTLYSFETGFNWRPVIDQIVQHLNERGLPWLAVKGVPKIVAAVKEWAASTAGSRWLAAHAVKGSFVVKVAEWSVQEGKDLGSYATFAIAHGQRSVVTLTAAGPQVGVAGIGPLTLGTPLATAQQKGWVSRQTTAGCELASPRPVVAKVASPVVGEATFDGSTLRLVSLSVRGGVGTTRGIRIGATAAAVRRAYPAVVTQYAASGDPLQLNALVWRTASKNLIWFLLDRPSGRVTSFEVPTPQLCE